MSTEKKDELGNFFDTQLKSYVEFERQLAHTIERFLTKFLGSVWFLNTALFISVV